MTRQLLAYAICAVWLAGPTTNSPAQAQGFSLGPIGLDLSSSQPRLDLDLSGGGGGPFGSSTPQHHVQPQPSQRVSSAPFRLPADRSWNLKKPPQTGPQQKQPAVEKPDPATQIKQFAEQAKEALRNRNYGQALKMADQIVAQAPKDADALQFRCLVHLGLGDYASSARDAYNAVQLGPLWNEATLKQLYGDLAVHDRQLQLLQLTCQAQPDALAIHFVRAHQHLLRGQLEAGRAALQDVLRVRPEDPIATRLLAAVPPTDTTDVAADGF